MTDTEAKVRKIAEWMGLKHALGWGDDKGLWIMDERQPPSHLIGRWFAPHADWIAAAADRERVMMKMAHAFTLVPETDEHDFIVITDGCMGCGDSLGLAFIDAVCQWIDAQEPA